MSNSHRNQLLEIVYGHWLSKGVMTFGEMKIADCMKGKTLSAKEIAERCNLDAAMTYRFLRMLSNVEGLVIENVHEGKSTFTLGPLGDLMCSDHPQGFADISALQNSEAHWQAWSSLPKILKTGKQNGFVHAYGKGPFEYMEDNKQYKQVFNSAMSGLSKHESLAVVDAYLGNWGKFSSIVDIGGGHGYLLASILSKGAPKSTGIIMELEQVVQEAAQGSTLSNLGVGDRCSHVVGDVFNAQDVPKEKDLYMLKRILHDWSDQESKLMLSNIRKNAASTSTLIVVDTVVPTDPQKHISKLMDVHMMCWGNGRERTQNEFQHIYDESGWTLTETIPIGVSGLCLVVGKIKQ